MRPRARLAALAVLILGIEIAIAAGWIGGRFVRVSLGDILAVIFVHFTLRALLLRPVAPTALVAVFVGFVVEASQYLGLADRLGLATDSVLRVVIGDTYAGDDLLMYIVGGFLAWLTDRLVCRQP